MIQREDFYGTCHPTFCKKWITLNAPAKINLTFDIQGLLPGGYHQVETVMHPISLSDEVTVGIMEEEGIVIYCDRPGIPLDRQNLCDKAVWKFFEYIGKTPKGTYINIEKRIPFQAGMAGGSADAAAVIKALNYLYGAGLSTLQMEEIGENLGADVPFCIRNQSVLATGFGEKLKNVPLMPECWLVVVKPPVGSSTAEAFQRVDEAATPNPEAAENMLEALESGDIGKVASGLYNVFEEILQIPEVEKIRHKLLENGALGAQMSGSGTAVFGIFSTQIDAGRATEKFTPMDGEVFLSKPYYA